MAPLSPVCQINPTYEICVTADPPELTNKDAEVTVKGDKPTIKGERSPKWIKKQRKEGRKVHRVECMSGSFHRSIQLPFEFESYEIKGSRVFFYPVTGGFSRSLVNFAAGAATPLASIITDVLIALTVLLFTPLLYFLPQATLAAIIVAAVANLIDLKTLRLADRDIPRRADPWGRDWHRGGGLSIALYLWRTSRPHMAEVGRVAETEHFRNVLRHEVQTHPDVLAVRVDESLYFANTAFLEDELLARVADQPRINHLVRS